jgi:hypothetical protein
MNGRFGWGETVKLGRQAGWGFSGVQIGDSRTPAGGAHYRIAAVEGISRLWV